MPSSAPSRRPPRRRRPRPRPPPTRPPRRHRRETIRPRRHSSRAPASTSRVRRKRPGISISTWRRAASTTPSAIRSACFRITSRRWSMPCLPRSARRPIFRSPAAPLRDVLTDSVSLGVAPDMLFQLISYITGGERRQKAKALGSGGDPDGDAATLDVLAALEKFPGIRPDPGSVHRSARSAAAAALFDRVLAESRARQSGAHHRHRALQDRQARAVRRRLDLLRRPHRSLAPRSRPISRRRSISVCPPTRRSRSS